MITVTHTNHTTTAHEGEANVCPRCRRAPLFDVRKSAVWQASPWEANAFCACEDSFGIVDTGVRRWGGSPEEAIEAVRVAWNDHDHVLFRFDADRVSRMSDRARVLGGAL